MGPGASPTLLAVETATERASLALGAGGEVLAARELEPGLATAEGLLPALDALLSETSLGLDDVEGFALSIGPGSFTGLRVGLASVKGLAFGTGRPAVAVSTLAALARDAGPGPVAALLDARRGELYAAGFAGGEPAPWLPESVLDVAEVAARLPEGCTVVGEGLSVCEGQLREARGDALQLRAAASRPLAHQVAALGAEAWRRGEARAAEELVPRYLRRAEAEVKRTGLRFESP